jgi:nicotinamide-nucleotide amidase
MPERNVVQAMIPRGATTFYNFHGTAPGFGIPPVGETESSGRCARAALVALPGPPKEWKAMWDRDAGLWLCSRFPNRPLRRIECLHVAMLPESTINERLHDLFTADPRIELTLLADRGHIRIRLILTTDSETEGESLADDFVARIRERLPAETILSGRESGWSIEQEIHALLCDGKRRIAVAESCTGGLVAARITDVPGSSAYFHQGFVTYSNEAKCDSLGVSESALLERGAVSRECALEMAAGARSRTAADAALSITGIAGPGGGTEEKPVGTVWFAMDTADRGAVAIRRRLPGNRDNVREWACRQGLDLIRRWAASLPWPK